MFKSQLSRWARDRSGNVAMMFALAAPVMMLGVGFAIDYGLFARAHVRLEMLADEATLSMTSAAGMAKTDAQAMAFAQNLFCSQAVQIPNLAVTATQDVATCKKALTFTCPNSSPTDCSSSTVRPPSSPPRVVNIAYNLTYTPMFATLLNISALPEKGASQAISAGESVNYYVLLDNQGSMALPASSAGITAMMNATKRQNGGAGCAFACHEAAPDNPPAGWPDDTQGNLCSDGSAPNAPDNTGAANTVCAPPLSQQDNYSVARNTNFNNGVGIPLRIDAVSQAMTALIADAKQVQSSISPQPNFQFQVWSVDAPSSLQTYNPASLPYTVMPLTSTYQKDWATYSPNFQLYEVYSDGSACADVACSSGNATAIWSGQNAVEPYYVNWQDVGWVSSPMGTEMKAIATAIQNNGIGDGKPGDKPKATLIVVTDGIEDAVINGSLYIGPWDQTAIGYCNTLKQAGVKIAILYTTYYPAPGLWLYNDFVAQYQPGTANDGLAAALNKCASSGLFMTAGVDDNLTTDLEQLFQIVNQSSRLTQ